MKRPEEVLPADTTVLATGVQENKDVEDYLKDLQSEFYKIGDCRNPRKAIDALYKKPKLAGQKKLLIG
jgi:hypothetical protein